MNTVDALNVPFILIVGWLQEFLKIKDSLKVKFYVKAGKVKQKKKPFKQSVDWKITYLN